MLIEHIIDDVDEHTQGPVFYLSTEACSMFHILNTNSTRNQSGKESGVESIRLLLSRFY